MALRIAERFGQDPFAWWEGLNPGQQLLLLAHEQYRMAEEAKVKELAAIIAGGTR